MKGHKNISLEPFHLQAEPPLSAFHHRTDIPPLINVVAPLWNHSSRRVLTLAHNLLGNHLMHKGRIANFSFLLHRCKQVEQLSEIHGIFINLHAANYPVPWIVLQNKLKYLSYKKTPQNSIQVQRKQLLHCTFSQTRKATL